jgi:hypothetical protein
MKGIKKAPGGELFNGLLFVFKPVLPQTEQQIQMNDCLSFYGIRQDHL